MPDFRQQNEFFERLHNIAEMLDALQVLPGALFMIKDVDSRYVYMSRELTEAIHQPANQRVVGKTDFDIFPRIVAERFRDNDLLVLRDGRTLENELQAVMYFDAPAMWCFSSKTPLRNQEGKIIGLVTTNRLYRDVMGDDDELTKLLPAVDRMTKHYEQKITVDDLAERCGISSSYFMKIFRERLGTTARQFLEHVRMHHAMHDLKHTSDSIASIAHRSGFYDHSSFVKRFKRHAGITPLNYRRDYRQQISTRRPNALPSL